MSILGQQIEGRMGVVSRDFAASSYGMFVAKVYANEEYSEDLQNRSLSGEGDIFQNLRPKRGLIGLSS